MKKIFSSLMLVLFALVIPVQGICAEGELGAGTQNPASSASVVNYTDVLALKRSYLQLQMQKIVLDNLQLTPGESEKFWPVFRAYQNSFEPIGDRLINLILKFNEKFENMSDEEALAMLKESQDIQDAEQGLKREYVEKFSEVLSPKKVLRFYQIDNKMRAEIRYNLSLEIPLLEVPEESAPAEL